MTDPTEFPIGPLPTLTIVKVADDGAISDPAAVGDVITYSFTVTNTGNVILADITIDDPLPGLVLSGAPIASLAPGDTSEAITGRYVITLDDTQAEPRRYGTRSARSPRMNMALSTCPVPACHGPSA